MKVLLVGSGGREHALAWKMANSLFPSPRLSRLWIAPGNPGTASLGENVPVSADDFASLLELVLKQAVDLVIIGPEAPLAAGLADVLRSGAQGLKVFGPSQAAARIESSKAFAKDFMIRHGIPTGRFASFTELQPALEYLRQAPFPVVIKASGLAAGKGVILPETQAEAEMALRAMLAETADPSGQTVVIEERLSGPEVSLLAFTDGVHLQLMPPAQDHKRLLDGDRGPNTGGMGAYAPAPVCPPELAEEICRRVLKPAVDGLRQEGCPFVGVLYAGMMLTPAGPKVLEFNCRFGDPETQVILPLLESDLVEIAVACAEGRLDQVEVEWKSASAACVVLASENYPGQTPSPLRTGAPIHGLAAASQTALENSSVMVFHAGTRLLGNQVVAAGGRVLGVTGIGPNLRQALAAAYQAAEQIQFAGMQFRRDIGAKAFRSESAYTTAGVDIDAGNQAVALMRSAVQSTYGPEVLAGVGAFGGQYDAAQFQAMSHPVLVASVDGIGTKVKLAAQFGRYRSLGQDIVNHCINDILVQGARPLFFLDYFAASHLLPEVVAEIVAGMAEACRQAGCALLGGETAEMPGVYQAGEFDVAGAIVGIVEKDQLLPRPDLAAGDVLVGLASSGPHTNGYSLIRKVFENTPLDEVDPALGIPLSEALLAPHRSYLKLLPLLAEPAVGIKALAHITGGGFVDNLPRILPATLSARLDRQRWPKPILFERIQQVGNIDPLEMYRVFNMGVGMVVVLPAQSLQPFQAAWGEPCWAIGELISGRGTVELI